MRTAEAARGRWYEILIALGVDESYLVNRHGPCPICGGKDRYRFDDKDGTGSYYCNQCGPGDGLLLLRKLHGWDFKTAAAEVDRIIGRQPDRPNAGSRRAKRDGKREDMCRLLEQATDRGIVEQYLRGRGLSVVPSALRGHPALPYYTEPGKCVGKYPAMLAPLHGADGRLRGVLRTYLADVRPRKKLITADGVRGAAVRLFDHAGVLGVSEGIETAIGAHELFGLPVWAAVSTSGMESFEPPLGVVKVVVLADHDRSLAGHKAAYTVAHRLAISGLGVEVKVPPQPGTDWNDVLLAQPRRSTA